MDSTTYEDALRVIDRLTPEEKRRLREELEALDGGTRLSPRESLYGIAAHLGPAPSSDAIDEVLHDAWSTFPRDDI